MKYMEMIAKLGVGSAHPGGFSATLEQLKYHPIPKQCRILEVGCGTGRTACYLAKQGYDVTAVDIMPGMVKKAQKRAKKEKVNVTFLQADVRKLPFAENEFDVVIAESVSIFTETEKALAEYYRVLKAEGTLYDREIVAMKEMPPELKEMVLDLYSIEKMPASQHLLDLLESASFQDVKVWNLSSFPTDPKEMWEDQVKYPDPIKLIDEDAFGNQAIWQSAAKYDEMMRRFRDCFAYGTFIGTKRDKG